MRTKALLLGAMIGAASLATSMAQVYSVNIVGYINVPIYTGWNLVANQLNNSAGNTVANLMPAPPTGISVFTYDGATQSYKNSNFDSDFLEWDVPGLQLNPGYGAFILNGGATFTVTLVGEVQTGTSSTPLYAGWQLLAPVVPQAGNIASPEMGYVPSPAGDSIFMYDGVGQKYSNMNFDGDFQEWDTPPNIEVARGFFALRSSAGTWTRTFNVGP